MWKLAISSSLMCKLLQVQKTEPLLQKEMEEYTEQLTANPSDYTTFIRSTGSEAPYTDLFYTTKSLPADVTARLDSVAVGGVFGPYYNVSDNTLNSFKKLATLCHAGLYRVPSDSGSCRRC